MMKRFVCAIIFAVLLAFCAEGAVNITKSLQQETRKQLLKSALKQYSPYLKDGLKEAFMGNWQFISSAYNDKAEWSEALSNMAVDTAGYTVTPVLVDGIMATSKSKFAVILKEAELGVFCWDAGKEFFSYVKGGTTQREFSEAVKNAAVSHAETLPVKVLGFVVSSAGYSFIAPAVIIAGEFAIQRLHDWYEFERWKNTVYVDDIRAVLGDDLMNAFTLANPEKHHSLADPEKRPSLANP